MKVAGIVKAKPALFVARRLVIVPLATKIIVAKPADGDGPIFFDFAPAFSKWAVV